MKINGLLVLGMVLLIAGSSIGWPGIIGIPENDFTPPQTLEVNMFPAHNGNYSKVDTLIFWARDYESGIAKIECEISLKFPVAGGSSTPHFYQLQHLYNVQVPVFSGTMETWEVWGQNITSITTPGAYNFGYTIYNGFQLQSEIGPRTFYISTTLSTMTLTVLAATGGWTDPASGTWEYPANSIVTMNAFAVANYVFSHWTVDATVTLGNPINITMQVSHTVQPVFRQLAANETGNEPPEGNQPPEDQYPKQQNSWLNLPTAGFLMILGVAVVLAGIKKAKVKV